MIFTNLQGVSIYKQFMPSVANVNGTDLSTYKVVAKEQFAFNPMHVGRDEVLPIAMLDTNEPVIVSPAYAVFEIIDKEELLPEYLMMWCRRPEFDRNVWFTTDSSVRGGFSWDDFCEMTLPVPLIEKQWEIVKEYQTIVDRIRLNERLNQKLEEMVHEIYRKYFFDEIHDCTTKTLNDVCSLITDGKHGDCENDTDSGFYFVSAKDLINREISYGKARQITEVDFKETDKRTNLSEGDILLTNSGTIGRMAIVRNIPETRRTTFQKSVAILKPKHDKIKSFYLYCLLRSQIKSIIELAGGTSQSNLLLSDIIEIEINYPGYEKVLEFECTVSPAFNMSFLINDFNKNLNHLKSIILSRMAIL